MGIGGTDSTARQRHGETRVKKEGRKGVRHGHKGMRVRGERVAKVVAVVGICGGVLTGSGGEGGVGDMVATGMSGNGG